MMARMGRALVLVMLLAAGCSAGARRPMSCNGAFVEPVVRGDRFGVRLTDVNPRKVLRYVRVDVLPEGEHFGTWSLDASAPHVRRLETTTAPIGEREVTFAFDGRDDAGRPLPHGSYEVYAVARTEDLDEGCVAGIALMGARLTTLTR